MAKKASEKFVPCYLKGLPIEMIESGRKLAIEENPANGPRLDTLVAAMSIAVTSTELTPSEAKNAAEDLILDHPFLAAITQRYWGSSGVKLSVSFLDNPSVALRNRILGHFNAWGDFCNASFEWSQSGGDIRIARSENAYYSYLGTDIRLIPRNQHTMMLGGFTDRTPDAEMRRVAAHECGHSMGFPHEHLRRDLISLLDEAKTLAYFRRTQGWSDATTRSNVLTPLEERSIMGSEVTDETSIMCYGLPGSITKSGKPIPGGNDFSATDKKFAAQLYPKSSAPVDPGPAPDEVSITIPRSGKWVWKGPS